MKMRLYANEKGTTLILAIAALLILSLMAVILVSLVGKETFGALYQTQSLQTFDVAEAGAHRALTYLSREGGSCTAISGSPNFTDVPMGQATFTVTATLYNPSPTTLSAGIGTSDTTIPVGSTANYAPAGRIAIGSEFIHYSGTTATSFTGARRGMDGTTTAAHSSGVEVAQYQCTFVSTSTRPGAFGESQRVIEVMVQ